MSSKNDRELIPMIPQQYGCLSRTWTMIISIDKSQGSNNRPRTIGKEWLLREGELVSTMVKTLNLLSNIKCSGLKPSTQNHTKWTQRIAYTHTHNSYIYIISILYIWIIKNSSSVWERVMGVIKNLGRVEKRGHEREWRENKEVKVTYYM